MEERVEFQTPCGVTLIGALNFPEKKPTTGVVTCHGMMSTKDGPKHVGLAQRITKLGHAVLRFDFQGRGESPGDLLGLSFSRQVDECQAAINFIRGRGVSRIALVGSSMGGTVAILAAARENLAALATLAAVGRPEEMPARIVGEKGMKHWQRRGQLRFEGHDIGYSLVEDALRIDVAGLAKKISCPWHIIHGSKDEVIPVSDAQALAQASGGKAELIIVPGADHQFSQLEIREQLLDDVAAFLDQALRSPC
jgi:Dipeptidyl aminopeptidases/acylaminoacyl-peptidases